MRRVAAGEASQFDGVLHKGLPLRVLSNNDLILKDDPAKEAFGHPDGTDYSGGFHSETAPIYGDEGSEEDEAKKLCKYLSMAMSCAMELGDQDLEDEISNLHTRCEEQYGVDTYE